MIIELIGPPGSGKSTLRRALDGKILREDGRKIVDLTQSRHFRDRGNQAVATRRWAKGAYLFANLLGFLWFRKVKLSDTPKALEWAATTFKVYERARVLDPSSEIGLLDEGILTRIQLSLGKSAPRQLIRKYLSFFPRPTHILFVRRPIDDLRIVWDARFIANPTIDYEKYCVGQYDQAEETVEFANWFLSTFCDEETVFEISGIPRGTDWVFDRYITLFPLRSNR